MALYEYQSEDGERVMVEKPMTSAPSIGHRIRRGGKEYRRVPSSGTSTHMPAAGRRTASIVGWSLEQKDQMDPALHQYVDGWNEHGVPCFSSVESAKRFSGATRDKVEKDDEGQFYDYGDGPDGIEANDANMARDRVKFDK